MGEELRFDDDTAFTLMDDAATVARVVRTSGADLEQTRIGGWSAMQCLGHITLMGEVFAGRVARCIEEEEPPIPAVEDGAFTEGDPMDLSKRLLAAHQKIVALLQNDVPARHRVGIHSERGRVTAGWLAGYCAKHSHEHTEELAARFPPAS